MNQHFLLCSPSRAFFPNYYSSQFMNYFTSDLLISVGLVADGKYPKKSRINVQWGRIWCHISITQIFIPFKSIECVDFLFLWLLCDVVVVPPFSMHCTFVRKSKGEWDEKSAGGRLGRPPPQNYIFLTLCDILKNRCRPLINNWPYWWETEV